MGPGSRPASSLRTAGFKGPRQATAAMWYPEEPVTYCRQCDQSVPLDCFWRGQGTIIGPHGEETRTAVLYSVCPECGNRNSVGLDGPAWFRVLYTRLWKLRYPATHPPQFEEQPRYDRGAESVKRRA